VPALRRVGVLGDVHAEDGLLEAALDHLARYDDLDALLCTGDLVTGPGDAGKCLEMLRAAGALCVRGNHDRWFLEATRREPGVGYDSLPDATPDEQVSAEARVPGVRARHPRLRDGGRAAAALPRHRP